MEGSEFKGTRLRHTGDSHSMKPTMSLSIADENVQVGRVAHACRPSAWQAEAEVVSSKPACAL